MGDSDRAIFRRVSDGFIYFQALATGCDLDLFAKLAKRPGQTRAELAADAAVNEEALRSLLLNLCLCGLLTRDAEGRYTNTSVATTFLLPDNPLNALAQVDVSRKLYYRAFEHLTDSVRKGTNAGIQTLPGDEPMLYARLAHSPDLQQLFYRNMGRVSERTHALLTKEPKFRASRHILDVGGGSGGNSIALAKELPDVKITIVDLPTSIEVPKANVAKAGLSHRIDVVGLDVFKDPLPTHADTVLYSHFVEIFDEQRCAHLMRSAYAALPNGGQVAALGFAVQPDEMGGPSAARLSIYFLTLASGQGYAYAAADYDRWMRAAGFGNIQVSSNDQLEAVLVLGNR